MKILFIALVSFVAAANAYAADFATLVCKDASPLIKAPVFFDIEGAGPRFTMGNVVPTGIIPGATYKDPAVFGDITSTVVTDSSLVIEGSFDSRLVLTIKPTESQGRGFVTGPIKYEPRTGDAHNARIENYPVVCLITR